MMCPHWIRMDMVLILKFPFTWGPHLYWKTRQSRAETCLNIDWFLSELHATFALNLATHTHTHQSDMSIWTEELCKIQFSPIPQVFLLRCLLIWLVGTSAVSGCVASHQLHSGYTHTYTPMIVHRGLWSLHVSVRLKRPQLCIDFRLSNCKTDVSSASL